MARLGAFALLTVLAVPLSDTQAGVYSPDELMPFPVRADGTAEEMPFEWFKSQLVDRLNVPNPAMPLAPGKPNLAAAERLAAVAGGAAFPLTPGDKPTYRGTVLRRIEARQDRHSSADAAWLAADLIRAGRAGEAVNLLRPRTRDRAPDFAALANLAHGHAARGEWEDAIRAHGQALFDAEPPSQLPGATPEQTRWLLRVERDYYRRWLRMRQREAAAREPPEEQDVYPLFPARDGEPVRFVSDRGGYEPGKLAAAEKAKLPPDAIAIVQQMLLWSPDDTRMLWLLGELYTAKGEVLSADDVFDQCTWGRGFTNRKKLMDHRHVVREAAEKARKEAPADVPLLADAPPESPQPGGGDFLPSRDKLIAVGAVFGAIVLVLLALQFRAIGRRLRGCGPAG